MQEKPEKMQKNIERGPGNARKMSKKFLEKPSMNDFKNRGFHIKKIEKADLWKKLEVIAMLIISKFKRGVKPKENCKF